METFIKNRIRLIFYSCSVAAVLAGCGDLDLESNHSSLHSSIASIDDGAELFLPVNDDDGDQQAPSGIPDIPRRRLSRQVQWYDITSFSAGLGTKLGGTISVNFDRGYSIIVWLFVPGETDALTESGQVRFSMNTPDNPAEYICRFVGHLNSDPKVAAQMSIFGTGVGKEKGLKDLTSITQTSPSFKVDSEKDNWDTIFEKCRAYGEEKKLKASIDRDLMAMTKNIMYHESGNECAEDVNCSDWYNGLDDSLKQGTVAECHQRQNETQTKICVLRSAYGSACPVRESKTQRLLSSGDGEYPCARGLKCDVKSKGGLFTAWKASCSR